MAQVSKGEVPAPDTTWKGVVYLTLQELATRIAHRNTGKLLDDPVGYERDGACRGRREPPPPLLPRPASGRDRSRSVEMMIAIERQVRTFEMPGTGIPDFDEARASASPAPASTT